MTNLAFGDQQILLVMISLELARVETKEISY